MKIVIGHLFYDLLNLYGESGNILAIKNALENKNIEVEIKQISINDELNLEELDYIYIGSGTENNQLIALDYLKKYKNEIIEAINNNKLFLVTGNSIELFGKEIVFDDDLKIEAIGAFDYYTVRTKNRIVSECKFNFDEINSKIIGFTNHQGLTKNIKNPLFVKYKEETNEILAEDGIHENNFFGTYVIGPLLVRNPEFLEYIIEKLILSKKDNLELA